MRVSDRIYGIEPASLSRDFMVFYGSMSQGAIEIPALTGEGSVIETGYYFGDLQPKSVIGVSSQVGCPCGCCFCEAGDEGLKRNLMPTEMYDQALMVLKAAQQFGVDVDAKKHKVSVARTGEPLFNPDLVEALGLMSKFGVSYKVSTVFPDNENCMRNFVDVAEFAAGYDEPVQIQISLISTSEEYRKNQARTKLAGFKQIRRAADRWFEYNPDGRKVNLSLILTNQTPAVVEDVADYFPPNMFRFRFRNYIPNRNGGESGLMTVGEPRYQTIKKSFADAGYEVGDWAKPMHFEWRFGLSSNVTRGRYLRMLKGEI